MFSLEDFSHHSSHLMMGFTAALMAVPAMIAILNESIGLYEERGRCLRKKNQHEIFSLIQIEKRTFDLFVCVCGHPFPFEFVCACVYDRER